MADGVQRTPFDTIDLGGQLLQALVQAQATKEQKEQMKLREKELALREQEFKLSLAPFLSPTAGAGAGGVAPMSPEMQQIFNQFFGPPGATASGAPLSAPTGAQAPAPAGEPPQSSRGALLSQMLGFPVQPYVPPAEQEFAKQQEFFKSNPEAETMHRRLQSYGSVLPPEESFDAARIAAGLKTNRAQRLQFGLGLIEQFGSAAQKQFAPLLAEEGIRPITGKTIGERRLDIERKAADRAGAAADAARIRARQETTEFLSQGFVPLPNSEASRDPALFQKLLGEYIDFNLGNADIISPEAASQVMPTARWAAVMKAAAEPSPELATTLTTLKTLVEAANLKNVKPTPEMLERIQALHERAFQLSLPPGQPGEGEAASEPSTGWLKSILGIVSGPDFKTMTLSGRPLKPALATALSLIERARSPVSSAVTTAEPSLQALETAYQKILPLITTEPGKPPTLPKTLGNLSSPRAQAIPEQVRNRLQSLVFAFANSGASPQDAAAMEEEMVDIFTTRSPAEQQEYINAVLEDIDELRSTER